jgi:GT2 family glycosyltransferase
VVLNFNYARYLGQAIESALVQTYPAVEVVVVDDCSTDDSREVIAAFGDRVVACLRPANGGMSASANTGFAASRGSRVLFLDADDYLYPHALETMAARWRPGVVQAQARLDLVDAEGRVEDIFPPLETAFPGGDVRPLLARRGRYPTTVTTGLAFARTALDRVMPIPEAAFDRSADGYLAAVVPLFGEVVAIEQRLGAYRRHAANHSGFAANIATRARWRVDHDAQRYAAMRRHAPAAGVTITAEPGLADPLHLEERLASLCFDPAHHPYPADRRAALGLHGLRAALAAPLGAKRKAVLAAIFATAGFAPRPVARTLLAWKMERSSRPQVVDRLSGWLRRNLG